MEYGLKDLLYQANFSLNYTFLALEKTKNTSDKYLSISILDESKNPFGNLYINFPMRINSNARYIEKILNNKDSIENFFSIFTSKFQANFKIEFWELTEYISLDNNCNIIYFRESEKKYVKSHKVNTKENCIRIGINKNYEMGLYTLTCVCTINLKDVYKKQFDEEREKILKEIKENIEAELLIKKLDFKEPFNRVKIIQNDIIQNVFNKIKNSKTRSTVQWAYSPVSDFAFQEFVFLTRRNKYYNKYAADYIKNIINEKFTFKNKEQFYEEKFNYSSEHFSILYNQNCDILKAKVILEMLRLNRDDIKLHSASFELEIKFSIFDGSEKRESLQSDYNLKKMFYKYLAEVEHFNKLIQFFTYGEQELQIDFQLNKRKKTDENKRSLIIKSIKNTS
ncbi:protein of unknown function [Acetoanaerobium sticklandii]|uniref:Uncharacterized protein n=1 Tax=Acetoanaerobium sticklandii (strain ATCC 12662 / DSM 519 / JCM 1433 / CCUG 9281 / NCIMB 10654 / HF) TaxID=499177 RepID=E3PY72_ACESD|nr:hypothetical protein [Acetoanaerobium sticklandii]CBH21387.1 protein of unknown function [Acetoanaerobium sticklandii]